MKLTNLSKILIVLVIMVVLFFVFRKFIPQAENRMEGTTTDNIEVEKAENKTASATSASFNYVPKSPVNGKMKGVVELGASGFNSFVISIDGNKNWKLDRAEWGNSLVYDGLASGEDVSKGLKKYISDMLDYGVSGKEIHFVVSSGARTVPETKTIINELKNMKYVVNTVTPEQEAQYALLSVLPPEYESSAFVVDIGSGNTKISWKEGGKIIGKEGYGAKYYTKGKEDEVVFQHTYQIAAEVPESLTNTCFIIGGVPFSLAKMDRQGDERFTIIKAAGEYEADGAKMKSGLNIYNAIAESTECETFVFDWHANFTIGFLLTL